MIAVSLQSIEKIFANAHVAVRGLDLAVDDGELLVLVGPSGCGKTTTLRLVAGLESPTAGRVFIGERDVTNLPPRQRDLAMVFQSHTLYPHMTVRRNLEFGLRLRHTPRHVMVSRVQSAAAALGIEGLLERMPAQLSGGERQRVALGRAIVREPRAFLLDEPLSNLDVQLRVDMRTEIRRLQRRLGTAMLYVTHDQEEAMTLGDRVAVLRDGALQQVGTPMDVYGRPANKFVAGFIGSPSMNFFGCRVENVGGRSRLVSSWFGIELEGPLPTDFRELTVGVRPQDVSVVATDKADVLGRVDLVEPLGKETLVYVRLRSGGVEQNMTLVVPAEATVRVNEQLPLRFTRTRLHLFQQKDGARVV